MKSLALFAALLISVGAASARSYTTEEKVIPGVGPVTIYRIAPEQAQEDAPKITKEESEQAKVIGAQQDQIEALDKKVAALNQKVLILTHSALRENVRIQKVEAELQRTRDQVANCLKMLAAKKK